MANFFIIFNNWLKTFVKTNFEANFFFDENIW